MIIIKIIFCKEKVGHFYTLIHVFNTHIHLDDIYICTSICVRWRVREWIFHVIQYCDIILFNAIPVMKTFLFFSKKKKRGWQLVNIISILLLFLIFVYVLLTFLSLFRTKNLFWYTILININRLILNLLATYLNNISIHLLFIFGRWN